MGPGDGATDDCVVMCSVLDVHEELNSAVICTLSPGRVNQCAVTLNFEEDVSFTLSHGAVAHVRPA